MSAGETLRQVGLIAGKDLRATLRSKAALAAIIIAPLIMMTLLGYVFPSVGKVEDIPFALVNADDEASVATSPSNLFLEKFVSVNEDSRSFILYQYTTEEAAREALRSRDVRGILIVPPGFSDASRAGTQPATLRILYDQSNPALGRLVAGEAGRIVAGIGTQEAIENVQRSTRYRSDASAETFLQPYRSEASGSTAVSPSYFQFLAPGLMTLMAVGAVMSGLPASFNTEKTTGTLDTLLVAPVNRWTLIAGKVVAQFARGLFQAGILFGLAMLLFGVKIGGSLGVAGLILILTISSFVGIGVLLTALAASDEGGGLGMLFYLPALLLSGVMFPIEQLPTVLQWISRALPLTYAVTAMRKVMILGAGLGDVLPEILILLAFGIVSFAFAGRAFNRAMTR
ncbi:MAG TPA: ABC transporter permease [Candidatus Thermoplasmatota archaeon]|nr:ABC transporter permease [Candidatus Thermoplasmatota archaeon]